MPVTRAITNPVKPPGPTDQSQLALRLGLGPQTNGAEPPSIEYWPMRQRPNFRVGMPPQPSTRTLFPPVARPVTAARPASRSSLPPAL